MSDRVTLGIDRIKCDGHGVCADLVPELIELDDWGYPIIRGGAIRSPFSHMRVAPYRAAPRSRFAFRLWPHAADGHGRAHARRLLSRSVSCA